MKRCIFLIALVLPNFPGCMYYAYPTLTHVPEVTVQNPDGSVHAFRVEVDQTLRKPMPVTQYTLARLKIGERGTVPGQFELASATGLYNPLRVVDGDEHERSDFTMLVRIYRPGHHTQTVKAWEKSRELFWTSAPDLAAQEKAIDDLLAIPAAASQAIKGTWWDMRDDKSGHGLQPGGVSPGHSETLRFAANEYQRLANSPAAAAPNMQANRDRLRSKSQWLRTFSSRPADAK